eukprot:2644605-Rhodomonas_salina.1
MSGSDVAYPATRALCDALSCPVLTQRIMLCACYAMSGTDVASAGNADLNPPLSKLLGGPR